MTSMRVLVAALSLVLMSLGTAQGELKDENLLQDFPSDYKIDFQTRQGNLLMQEMVPKGESAKDWTEMITTQIFLNDKRLMPEGFQKAMTQMWKSSCKG